MEVNFSMAAPEGFEPTIMESESTALPLGQGALVPVIGLEPIRYCYHWILSPTRLPIPPFGQ